MRNTLRKSEILRGHSAFSDIMKNGERAQSTLLHCYFTKRLREKSRPVVQVGFGVPRKIVGLAVDRNRVKRLLREAYRKNKEQLFKTASEKNLDLAVVIMFRKTAEVDVRGISYATMEKEWNILMSKVISLT